MTREDDHTSVLPTFRIATVAMITVASAFSFQQNWPWLRKFGLVTISPMSLACLLSLLNGHNDYTENGLVALALSFVLRNGRASNYHRVFIAASVLTIELSLLLGLPVLWAFALLGSFLAVDLIECVSFRSTRCIDYVGINFALSSYERTCVSVVWSILLQRLVESICAIYSKSTTSHLLLLHRLYSVEQHLQVVEMVTTSVLCMLLTTETMVFGATQLINFYSQHNTTNSNRFNSNNGTTSTSTITYLRWLLLSLATSIYTHYILIPLLQHINIHNLPVYILQLVFREGYYELVLCINWVLLISLTVAIGFYAGTKWHWPRTCSRKLFHFLVVAMFVPCLVVCSKLAHNAVHRNAVHPTSVSSQIYIDFDGYQYRVFAFLVLALGVAVYVFVLFEYARLCLVLRTVTTSHQINKDHPSKDSKMTMVQPFVVVEQYMQLFLSTPATTASTITTGSTIDLRNKLEISHISLLLGCAGPVWLFVTILNSLNGNNVSLSLSVSNATTDVTVPVVLLSIVPYVGLLTLGVGDACAAVMGKLFGKHTWGAILTNMVRSSTSRDAGKGDINTRGVKRVICNSNSRTMEGSAACFLSMIVFGMYILYIQYASSGGNNVFPPPVALWDGLIELIVVCVLVTAAEAVTRENDNVVLPVYACMLLLGSFVVYVQSS